MDKKKTICAGIAGIAGAAIIGAGILFSGNVLIDNAFFPKDAEVIDLTDHALSEGKYLDICERFPDKQILWSVPFQGNRYAQDTASIAVSSLTKEDIQILAYLPSLKQIDATQCRDYDALAQLQETLPDCNILYQDSSAGQIRSDTRNLTITDANAEELKQLLPLLPQLQTLTLEGNLPETEALLDIKNTFPSVRLDVTMTVGGQELSTGSNSIDLTNAKISQQEILRLMPLFSHAEELILTGSSLTDAEPKSLIDQLPGIFVVCDLDLAGKLCSTDCVEIDISGCAVSVEEVEALLPYFPRLQKLDMSHCGIDNETMDALNKRYPDISIVWTLQIGRITVRTDDTVFFPSKHGEHNLPSDEELTKLRFCPDMIAIDIGHSKATNCNWAANMPHLKYLILADTKITDLTPLANATELLYLEVFTTGITDYTPLLGCTSLQDLNIGCTYADPEPLTKMTWLHNLSWHGILKNDDLREKALMLPEQLPDTNIVLETTRKNIGGIWRYLPHYYVFRDLIDGDFFNQEVINRFQDTQDAKRILDCDHGNPVFAGDVLAEIVRYKIDNNLPITGIKNVGSEKAEILYQTLCDSRSWYQQ